MKDKGITMAQWTNLKSFVNPLQLCEISGAIHLMLVSLMSGWLIKSRQILIRSKYFLLTKYSIIRTVAFSTKAYCKVVFKSAKNPEVIHFHSNPYY